MQTRDRLPLIVSMILAVSIAGILVTRHSMRTTRPAGVSPTVDEADRAHEAAGIPVGETAATAPGFEARLAEARSRLGEAPDDPDRLLDLARLLHDGHRPDEAVVVYRRALAADPNRADTQYDLAAVLAEMGQWVAATEVLEARLVQAPDDAVAQYDLGAIRANAGDRDGARNWFRRVANTSADSALRLRASQALERLEGGTR